MNNRETVKQIFLSGVKGVLPGQLINDLFSLKGSNLKIGYHSFDLDRIRNIYVIGAGKASSAMGHYVESILGGYITEGHIITKYGHNCKLKFIKTTEAGHPVPDENGFRATNEIVKIADKAGEDDLVICLISGGGSSLLADYPDTCTPDEIISLTDTLVKSGADINEMNAIRKHLSRVKGGQLAKHIWPAASITILISDVIGDPLDVIASGPTVPDNSTFSDALKVIENHHLTGNIPQSVQNLLEQGAMGIYPETPKKGDPVFSRAYVIIAGNNKTALQAARDEAELLGFNTFIITSELKGDITDAKAFIIEKIVNYKNDPVISKPVCLLFGGETTVKVKGNGSGGRNQHLALTVALTIKDLKEVTFLSGGTDGNDGNTEMAGAVVDSFTLTDAEPFSADPQKYLEDFDSYNFFKTVGGHVFTEPTMTNVMDLMIALIE